MLSRAFACAATDFSEAGMGDIETKLIEVGAGDGNTMEQGVLAET